jgi:hypothetical protein
MASDHDQSRLFSPPAEAGSSIYEYSTLPEGCIRLFRIERDTGTPIVRGGIEVHPLDNVPEYAHYRS